MSIKDKRLFLFDIDGVIKLGDTLIDGAFDLYNHIKSIGGKSLFITNNSTKSLTDYVKYFKNLGFDTNESEFITALSITTKYLLKYHKNDKIFVVGTKSLVGELKSVNLNITENFENNVNVVLVGFDNELNYKKITDACNILQNQKVVYLATNPDLRCPMPFGYIPDCGAIVDLIYKATELSPKYLGKPEPDMVNLALDENKMYTKEQTVVVGDRLYTDIACGINAGVDTCVVFTGEATKEKILDSIYNPTYEFYSVKEMLEEIKK